MKGINFLPWREQQKRQRKQSLLFKLVAALVSGFLSIVCLNLLILHKTQKQQILNQQLQEKLKTLSSQFSKIEALKMKNKEIMEKLTKLHRESYEHIV